jgi:UDP-apiose/xylose synthase
MSPPPPPPSPSPSPAPARLDLDGNPVAPLTICVIGAGGFIGSHLCEKLMAETAHAVLAVDVYCDKIRHLVDPAPPPHLAGRISFHRLNIKNDSRLEGLIKMADLVGWVWSLACLLAQIDR